MNRYIVIPLLLAVTLVAGAQNEIRGNSNANPGGQPVKKTHSAPPPEPEDKVPAYDSVLAKKLGADDLGMKTYVLVILKSGPAKIEDKELRDSLFAGHFSNMERLAKEGRLVAAGPFGNNDNQFRGLFLYDVRTIGEAEELVRGDPTVTNGIFVTEMYVWYGSAALPLLNDIHKKIRKR